MYCSCQWKKKSDEEAKKREIAVYDESILLWRLAFSGI
jgi:hypothetical protein